MAPFNHCLQFALIYYNLPWYTNCFCFHNFSDPFFLYRFLFFFFFPNESNYWHRNRLKFFFSAPQPILQWLDQSRFSCLHLHFGIACCHFPMPKLAFHKVSLLLCAREICCCQHEFSPAVSCVGTSLLSLLTSVLNSLCSFFFFFFFLWRVFTLCLLSLLPNIVSFVDLLSFSKLFALFHSDNVNG